MAAEGRFDPPSPAPDDRPNQALRLYLAAAAPVVIASAVAPRPFALALSSSAALFGAVALAVGLARNRPSPALPWWLIAGSVTLVLAAVAVGVVTEPGADNLRVAHGPAAVLYGLAFLPLLAGLALLGRSDPPSRTGLIDSLDSALAAMGVFLALWGFVLDPLYLDHRHPMTVGFVLVPLGDLLVLFMTAKLVLGVGLRTPSLVLLTLAMAAMLALSVITMVPAPDAAGFGTTVLTAPLAALSFVLLGAAGLHPSVRRVGQLPPLPSNPLSWRRIALFSVLAVLGPSIWVADLVEDGGVGDPAHYVIPEVAMAVLSLLLVGRLVQIARIAQRRSAELGRHSTALAEAIGKQEMLQSQLAHGALHDPLTGLSNRVVLGERMEWALHRRTGTGQHALLLLDLDRFKDVNDTLGHPVGDELLITVSHRLLETLPEDATLARLGGDEFAVFLEDVPVDEAIARAERLLAVLGRPYRIADRELFVTTSIGVAVTGADGVSTPASVLRDADLALYAAKDAGKNRVVLFRPELRAARLDHDRLSTGLRRALANDELSVEYQPVIDLGTDRIVAVEALARWRPSEGPPVPPTDFIPVAEENGLIEAIGSWVLRRACEDARTWYDRHGISVSVNVSGRQLVDPGFAGVVRATLAASGLPPEGLILEVTESVLVATASGHTAVTQLLALSELGIRIAIDDFGTGYSSLSYLSRLPVHIIKIDRSFLHQAVTSQDRESWAFTRAILELGRSLKLRTVAEGIETAEQADMLRRMHCPLGQGFLFARPVPPDVIDDTLAVSASVLSGDSGRPPFRPVSLWMPGRRAMSSGGTGSGEPGGGIP